MKHSRMLLLSLGMFLLAGCAANRSAGEGQPRPQANLITSAEIQQAVRGQNAFDLIRALRPNWLQVRGVQSLSSSAGRAPTSGAAEVMVYVDGVRLGGPAILRQILAADVQEARYLGATEATARFGTNHTAGAILITTRGRS